MLYRILFVLGFLVPFVGGAQCTITNLTVNVSPCIGSNNTFQITGSVTFMNAPSTGILTITGNNGGSPPGGPVIFGPYANNVPYNFGPVSYVSNGNPLTVTASFTANPACSYSVVVTSPSSCLCTADVGTFTTTTTGNTTTASQLCFGDAITLTNNGNFVAPTVANAPPSPSGYNPGLGYLVYACPPTIGLTPTSGVDINSDPCLLGSFGFGTSFNSINNAGTIFGFPAATFTNNTAYLVPITFYNTTSSPALYTYTNVSNPCYEMGPATAVQFLPQITSSQTQNCSAGTVATTLSGSSPALNPAATFSVVPGSLLPATASFVNTTCLNNGTITIQGLTSGQNYSYQVQTANGCLHTISGTFVGPASSAFTYPSANYCVGSANPSPTITGVAGGTFASSPAGLQVSPTTGEIDIALSTPGTYNVSYTAPGACTSLTNFAVNIRPLPTATISGNATVCQGAASPVVTFTGAGATSPYTFTYNINGGTNVVSPASTGNTFTINAPTGTAGSFIYNLVSVSSSFSCTQTQTGSITVNVTAAPSAGTLSGTQNICVGGTTTFSSTVAGGTWTTSAAIASPGAGGVITGNSAGTATITYTVTGSGGCPNATATRTVTVAAVVTPTFPAVGPYCAGATIPAFLTTSTNGITGTWSPAISNTATTTYTFTPTAGLCASTATRTVTINPVVTPTFAAVGPYCAGATIPALPTTSMNGVTGTWSPAISNTTTTTYTFTPTAGLCANPATLTITVNPVVTPTFAAVGPYCSGTAIPAFVTTSINGITGTWSPAISNTTTTTYTFTPSAGQCANTVTRTVTISPIVTPTFTAVGPYCSGATIPALPTTSTNGVTGTWSPAINNTATTTYTFTPTAGLCATTATMTITVNPNVTPTFTAVAAICSGAALAALPTTSNNGITGTWSPAINNTATTTYTFTPTAGLCATTATMTITVTAPPVAGSLSGTQNICVGSTSTFSSTIAGGSWSSSDPAIATIDATTGAISGLTAGTATMTYTVPGSGGCPDATETRTITVSSIPTATIAGTASACQNGLEVLVTLTGANGVEPYTFMYSVDAGPATPITSIGNQANVIVPTTNVGTFTYTLISVSDASGAGCSQTQSGTAVVTIDPLPTPVIGGDTDYCVGTTATITTVDTYVSYDWSPAAQTTQSIQATAASNPITVTVTDGNGCSGTSAPYNLIENTVIIYDTTITICQGQTALIHGNLESVAGLYTQNYPIANGCDSTLNVTLVVNPLPTVNAGLDQTVCENAQVTLSGAGATSYVWDNGVTDDVAFTSAVGTVTYTVTGTDANGCINTDAVDVTVNPNPIIDPELDQTFCAGAISNGHTFLSNLAGTTYAWTNSNTNIGLPASGTDNIASFTATNNSAATITGTITVTPTTGTCPGAPMDFDISVLPALVSTLSAPVAVCLNDTEPTITFTGSQGTAPYTFTYNIDGGVDQFITSVGNQATITAPTDVAGVFTYTITFISENGVCSAAQSVSTTVTVNDLPTIDAGVDLLLCFGEEHTFVATGGLSYLWDQGIVDGSTVAPPVGSTTYLVTGTDANGCENIDDLTIEVNDVPVIDGGADVVICVGESVTLVGSGGSGLTWTGGISDGVAFNPVVSDEYIVTGTGANGCVNTDTVQVTVNPLPLVDAGQDIAGCDGVQYTLTGSGAGAGGTYVWDNGVIDATPFNPPVGSTTYTVTGTDANGCENTDQLVIDIQIPPIVNFTYNQSEFCVPVTASFTNTSAPIGFNCVWTFSDGSVINDCGTVSHTFEDAGLYSATLQVESSNGCISSLTQTNIINVSPYPVAAFTYSPDKITSLFNEVEFENESQGATSYVWSFGDEGSVTSELEHPVHLYPEDEVGAYFVTLIASNVAGCTDTAIALINVSEELLYYVPNTFTPNNDQYNPTFKPQFTTGFNPQEFKLLIFNRWGEAVFESQDSEVGWNGYYGTTGQLCESGTYTWKIEFRTSANNDRVLVTGHVNLLK